MADAQYDVTLWTRGQMAAGSPWVWVVQGYLWTAPLEDAMAYLMATLSHTAKARWKVRLVRLSDKKSFMVMGGNVAVLKWAVDVTKAEKDAAGIEISIAYDTIPVGNVPSYGWTDESWSVAAPQTLIVSSLPDGMLPPGTPITVSVGGWTNVVFTNGPINLSELHLTLFPK